MSTENLKEAQDQQNPAEIPSRSRIPNVTLINIVLLVGLLLLYALYFLPLRSGEEKAVKSPMKTEISEMAGILSEGAFMIAFVNSDSIMANYKLAIRMREQFESEQRRLENDLQRRQRQFQEEVESYQRRIQLNLMTRENAQVKEQELALMQQELMQLNDTYANRLMNKEMDMNRELYHSITTFLRKYNETKGYDYILGFTPGGGGILYASEQHNITREILQGLNQEYDATN